MTRFREIAFRPAKHDNESPHKKNERASFCMFCCVGQLAPQRQPRNTKIASKPFRLWQQRTMLPRVCARVSVRVLTDLQRTRVTVHEGRHSEHKHLKNSGAISALCFHLL